MLLYLPDGLSMETIPGIVIECDSATEINSYTKLEPLDCVSPLLYEASKDPVCQQPCMWYIFSEEETERLRDVVTICAHFSFFLDLVVLATYAAYPKKRRFPNNIAWYITITSTLIAFLVVLTYWNGYKETFCVNETERRTMEGYCVVQGVLVLWLGLAAVFWWLFLVISLLCTIVLDVQVKKRHIRLMHIFCWGIPFVLNIYALSVDAVGYDGFSFFCSFGENANVTTEFVVLFGWMVASVAIGCPIVIWILIHVIKVARSVHKGRAFLQSYIRLLMIIISLMILFTFTFALRFHVRSMEKDIQSSLEENILCRGQSPDAVCEPPLTPSKFLWVMGSISPAIQGIIVFLTFGISKETQMLGRAVWRHLLPCGSQWGQFSSGMFSSGLRSHPSQDQLQMELHQTQTTIASSMDEM
eukprot:TRINITY_DN6921_c0_g1_i3.p1 TRINITY_DN6921_c0_g1~~TRINITY_DN6921_c0_g1_i3.p1  ORF type:complete len:415 (+),score=62.78 TRINITY_DN6921_c0_g1_i3:267-1511(+)